MTSATTTTITEPGIYDITAMAYHADPAPAPSLSSSIAREMVAYSPHHAWFKHPKLNTAQQPAHKAMFDLGTAAHAWLLQGERGFTIINARDFKTNAAKLQRDRARLDGKIPLLTHKWDGIVAMGEACRRKLAEHEDRPIPLTDGKAEQTLVWQEDGVWCRARLDWLHRGGRVIDDLKTTAASANPDLFTRTTLFNMGYDIQAAFYLRGLRAVTGIDGHFRFVVQENFPPYAVCVVSLAPPAMDLAARKVAKAIDTWRECLKSGTWPGYPKRTCWADLPPWLESQWMEREMREEAPAYARASVDDGRPLAEQLMGDDDEDGDEG